VSRVGVFGAGSWGTTLADLLARQGHDVVLWAYEPEVVEQINRERVNGIFLPGCDLAPGLTADGDVRRVATGRDLLLSVVPSHAWGRVLAGVGDAIAPGALLVSATKGLETGTLRRMSEVAAEVVPQARFVVLSGPSFAREVYQRQPTAVVAASADPEAALAAQAAFSCGHFRVYSHHDVAGVELGGALKNVIAIAAGILEGLGLGYNPKAALITRGLAEMTRLGTAFGAEPRTFAGLAGLGDLVLTATGDLSRNRSLGIALGRGESLAGYTAAHRTVAEGVNATQAALALADRAGVELPIAARLADILFEGKPPRQAIGELMERTLKAEQWT
jgi:glycerol-3-phosphate dehydrogenase (NAD(P)+)